MATFSVPKGAQDAVLNISGSGEMHLVARDSAGKVLNASWKRISSTQVEVKFPIPTPTIVTITTK